MMIFLDLVAKLSFQSTRQEAANDLARFLNASCLIIFIVDPELNILLPAPGFTQSLSQKKLWEISLSHQEEVYTDFVPDPVSGQLLPATGIKSFQESVAVLFGGDSSEHSIDFLQRILPVIVTMLIQEQKVQSFSGKAKIAADEFEKSERLTKALDAARKDLMESLSKNAKLLLNLKERNEDLEKINNELDNFVYTASHDLKAPVSNIEGLVKILKEYINKPEDFLEAKEIIALIEESILKFKDVITDLTDIAQIRRSIEMDQTDVIDLKSILDDIINYHAKEIKEADATITYSLNVEIIYYSKKNMWSILHNLISNALKYSDPSRKTEVNVSSKYTDGFVELEIRDNGLGMQEGFAKKIFSLFKRLHAHVEGRGIGLYLVKRILENSGGKIEVESQLGSGSTFKIFIPRRSA